MHPCPNSTVIRGNVAPCGEAKPIHRVLMPPTFSRFTPGDTRSLAARMADLEREAQEPQVSSRQFLIAVGTILLALAMFALLLTLV